MSEYLLGKEFWTNVAWLAVLAAVLTFAIRVISVVFNNMKGEGAFPYIVLVLMMLPVLFYALPRGVRWASSESLGNAAFVLLKAGDRQHGPVSVLAREKVLLHGYYKELIRRREQCEAYREKLETERAAMRGERGKQAMTRELHEVAAETARLEQLLRDIEDVASRLYFARFMSNLGIRTADDEMDGKVDALVSRTERTVREIRKGQAP